MPFRLLAPPIDAVLFDAYGTLVRLDPPAPRLRDLLARDGFDLEPALVEAAVAAEMAHYRRNTHRGADAEGLAEVRRECVAVLAEGLRGAHPPSERLLELLMEAMRFSLYPDVVPTLAALSARGMRMAVVSNWDCSLSGVLADLGIAEHFEVVVTSAQVGVPKPDPAPFHAALATLEVAPEGVVHCGDEPAVDGDGARAAGIRAVIVRRPPGAPGPGEIGTLADLAR